MIYRYLCFRALEELKKSINKSVKDHHLILDELTENKLFKQNMSK